MSSAAPDAPTVALPAPGRRVFFGISSFQVLAMFRRAMFYNYLSIYLRFFLGLTVTETTLFATLPMVLNVVFQTFVWGRLSDRLQLRRTLIIVGELLAALITVAVWYVHTLPGTHRAAGYVVIIGLSVVEIFWSMSNVGWTALLSDLYPEQERAGIQGRLSSVGAIGRLAGIWTGGLMYDGMQRLYEGWGFEQGALFFIASGVMAVSTIPVFFLPEGGVQKNHGSASAAPGGEGSASAEAQYGNPVSRRFLIFLVAMVFINFGMNAIALIKAQYLSLDEGFNISSGTLSYIFNSASASIFVVGLLVRRWSKRMGDELLLFAGTTFILVYLLLYVLAGHVALFFVSEFIAGAGFVLVMSASYAHASRLIPASHRGRQFAWFNATFFLSWGIPATFIAGPIIDLLIDGGMAQTLAYRMSFVASALLVAVGMVLLLVEYRKYRGALPPPGSGSGKS